MCPWWHEVLGPPVCHDVVSQGSPVLPPKAYSPKFREWVFSEVEIVEVLCRRLSRSPDGYHAPMPLTQPDRDNPLMRQEISRRPKPAPLVRASASSHLLVVGVCVRSRPWSRDLTSRLATAYGCVSSLSIVTVDSSLQLVEPSLFASPL